MHETALDRYDRFEANGWPTAELAGELAAELRQAKNDLESARGGDCAATQRRAEIYAAGLSEIAHNELTPYSDNARRVAQQTIDRANSI